MTTKRTMRIPTFIIPILVVVAVFLFVHDSKHAHAQWVMATFSTPASPYPSVDFSVEPPSPVAASPFTATDTTNYQGASPIAWLWDMGDTSTYSGSPTQEHTYAEPGGFTITLSVTDSRGLSCFASRTITIKNPIPQFREVLPQ